jgi:hypothetical protein
MSSAWRFVLAIGLVSLLVGAVSDVGDFWGLLPGCLGEGRWAWPLLLGYGLNLLATPALALFPLQMEVG